MSKVTKVIKKTRVNIQGKAKIREYEEERDDDDDDRKPPQKPDLPDRKMVDVLRPRFAQYYAFIEKVEIEQGRNERLYHLMMDCMSMAWFNSFEGNLDAMPPMDHLPPEAGACMVEATLTAAELAHISHRINAPHIQEDWWIGIELVDTPLPNCVEVLVYPIAGQDAATIGNVPNTFVLWWHEATRVRPPSLLIVLLDFASRTSI